MRHTDTDLLLVMVARGADRMGNDNKAAVGSSYAMLAMIPSEHSLRLLFHCLGASIVEFWGGGDLHEWMESSVAVHSEGMYMLDTRTTQG